MKKEMKRRERKKKEDRYRNGSIVPSNLHGIKVFEIKGVDEISPQDGLVKKGSHHSWSKETTTKTIDTNQIEAFRHG